MTNLIATEKLLNEYFNKLNKLDNRSKKKLINRLMESMDTKDDASFDLESIYGKWIDSRDSDEIIKEIKESRVDKIKTEPF